MDTDPDKLSSMEEERPEEIEKMSRMPEEQEAAGDEEPTPEGPSVGDVFRSGS